MSKATDTARPCGGGGGHAITWEAFQRNANPERLRLFAMAFRLTYKLEMFREMSDQRLVWLVVLTNVETTEAVRRELGFGDWNGHEVKEGPFK